MSEPQAPAVHIPVEHQSAPKQPWADKEVEKAAEEIRAGQFRPDLSDDADLIGMVSTARGLAVENPKNATSEQKLQMMEEMADSLALSQHPRVQEALARLELEKREAKTTQEAIEKAQMLHEMNERAAQKNLWDGQGRWIGKENEEMRVVNVIHWRDWLRRLEAVIGEGRIFVNKWVIAGRTMVMVPNTEYNRSLILLPGQESSKEKFLPVATIQPISPEWMIMKFNEYGEPTTARYLGWRTALLCLISKRIITEKQAHKAFPVKDGPASEWYRQQLFEIRNRDGVAA